MKAPIEAPEWAISATYHSEEEEEPSDSNNNNGGRSNSRSNSGSNNNRNGRTVFLGLAFLHKAGIFHNDQYNATEDSKSLPRKAESFDTSCTTPDSSQDDLCLTQIQVKSINALEDIAQVESTELY
ncbi:hypothetical protein C2G38_2168258 [Gigaspora rosea]|uniref:Uncharacterized protein n=1 Tax=Gigaspora rosea TaxID=44941 RepID=A0A397VX81_9GLOM|nr:hypothetical protein C2G38_2168258 [Gigaspora rosea]